MWRLKSFHTVSRHPPIWLYVFRYHYLHANYSWSPPKRIATLLLGWGLFILVILIASHCSASLEKFILGCWKLEWRLQAIVDSRIQEEQCRVHPGCGTTDQLFTLAGMVRGVMGVWPSSLHVLCRLRCGGVWGTRAVATSHRSLYSQLLSAFFRRCGSVDLLPPRLDPE